MIKRRATKELVLEHSATIFGYYFRPFSLGRNYKSPLRADKRPSFNIFKSKSGTLLYKDFGDSRGNAIDFVMNMHNVSFAEAIVKIVKELNLPYEVSDPQNKYVKRNVEVPQFKPKEKKKNLLYPIYYKHDGKPIYTAYDKKYWLGDLKLPSMQYLIKHRMYSARELLIGDAKVWEAFDGDPIYIYLEKYEGQWWRKGYRPHGGPGEKWRSDYPNAAAMLHGLDLMNVRSDELIITKSNKDSVVMDSLGYNVINTQGEDIPIPDWIIKKLKELYKDIYIFFDNDFTKEDNPGRRLSDKYAESYQVNQIIIPSSYEFTDTSELINTFNRITTRNLIEKWKIKR
jgi:hypothetical protein